MLLLTEAPSRSSTVEDTTADTPPPSTPAALPSTALLTTVRVVSSTYSPPPFRTAVLLLTEAPSRSSIVEDESACTPPPSTPAALPPTALLITSTDEFSDANTPPPRSAEELKIAEPLTSSVLFLPTKMAPPRLPALQFVSETLMSERLAFSLTTTQPPSVKFAAPSGAAPFLRKRPLILTPRTPSAMTKCLRRFSHFMMSDFCKR